MPTLSSPTDLALQVSRNGSASTERFDGALDNTDVIFYEGSNGQLPVRSLATSITKVGHNSGTDIAHSAMADTGWDNPLLRENPYYFYGSISEDILHRYLDKGLGMDQMSQWNYYPWIQGPSINSDFINHPLGSYATDTNYQHGQDLQMILDTGAKFIADVNGFWGGPGDRYSLLSFLELLSIDINYIHSHDPFVIFQAGIWEDIELISPCTLTFDDVRGGFENLILMFYDSLSHRETFVPDNYTCIDPVTGTAKHTFFQPAMRYPEGFVSSLTYIISTTPESALIHQQAKYTLSQIDYDSTTILTRPDISRPETQMYFYYLATKYIDAGCEAIHLGDIFRMSVRDPGYKIYWSLCQKIRAYGSLYARRKLVLLDAHVYDDSGDTTFATNAHHKLGYFYDPDWPTIKPPWQRQLLLDYLSLGIYYLRNNNKDCHDDIVGRANQPQTLEYGAGLLNHSLGGLHPQGWICAHSPYTQEFDHGGASHCQGCNFPYDHTFGYPGSSWFANQDEITKNRVIKYSIYKTRCYDPYGHLRLMGRRFTSFSGYMYRANTARPTLPSGALQGSNQQQTIKEVWQGAFAGSYNWVHHNFTVENIINAPVGVSSSLILVGSDKMYSIVGGNICGALKVSDNFNGGTWLGLCPTFASGSGIRVAALSDLVASPDGQTLLYIGVDGYIHGYRAHPGNPWDYDYFDFMKDGPNGMISSAVKAKCCLIYPTNDSVYFITTNGWVYGFVYYSGAWVWASPTIISTSLHHLPVSPEVHAVSGLTYDAATHRLYFVNNNGLLFYYVINSLFDYTYFACPGNAALMSQQLQIVGKLVLHGNRIYFIGHFTGYAVAEGQNWVHCLIDGPSDWGTVSPSYAALYGGQPMYGSAANTQIPPAYPSGEVAISPDGRTIAFLNIHNFVSFYYSSDGYNYSFHYTPFTDINDIQGSNSLQFHGFDLFYLSFFDSINIHCYKYQEDYCSNPVIQEYLDDPVPIHHPPVVSVVPGARKLRLSFYECGNCEKWSFTYEQVDLPHPLPTGFIVDRRLSIFQVDCATFPFPSQVDFDLNPSHLGWVPLSAGGHYVYKYNLSNNLGVGYNLTIDVP